MTKEPQAERSIDLSGQKMDWLDDSLITDVRIVRVDLSLSQFGKVLVQEKDDISGGSWVTASEYADHTSERSARILRYVREATKSTSK